MQIDRELIAYLEELARLRLREDEQEEITQSLGSILGYMDTLAALGTAGVQELSHPFPSVNAFREDAASASSKREQILKGAPAQKDGCFRVPKTVE